MARTPYTANAVRALPVAVVPPDHFDVRAEDTLLEADLQASIAVCLYDAVEEAGALAHLRIMPARLAGAPAGDASDDPLADVVLLDGCLAQLRVLCPAARHWQARIVAHLGSDGSLHKVAQLISKGIEHFCQDSGIRVLDAPPQTGLAVTLQFRPSMGQHRLLYR
jgi:hypothetical protein